MVELRASWVISALVAFAATGPLHAGTVAQAQTDATTTLNGPASITINQDLVLSTVFTPSRTGGTSIISPSGVSQVNGGLIAASAPSAAQATFTIAGQGGQSISVAVPSNLDLTRVGGSETVNVATSTDLLGLTGSQLLTGSLGGNGTLSFNVGGQINIGSDAVPGAYSGLLVVTAQYN